jgi:hypothetical protein
VCIGLALLCVALALSVGSSPAATPYVDGISDQSIPAWDGGFSRAYFAPYFSSNWVAGGHIREARYVVQWNIMAEPSAGANAEGDYRERFEAWYEDATSLGLSLDVSLVAYAGGLPSLAEYEHQAGQLLASFKSIRYLEAWNEPNDSPGLTAAAAGEYTNAADALCQHQGSCSVVAGNFLDSSGMAAYERQYAQALRWRPRIWGVHPYHAVHEHSEAPLVAFVQALPDAGAGDQIWFTEVGAYACWSGRLYGDAAQARDAVWLTDELMPKLEPTHVFYYEFLYKGHEPPPCGAGGADTALYVPSADTNVPDVPRAAASYIFQNTGAISPGAVLELVETQFGGW